MYKNYKLVKSQLLKDIDCNGILLEHIKTGARVLLLESSDENKTFCIGFRTPPKDSTGVPHIIEHSVLCGSKKYPVKEPFVELMKSSLNTFLNAMTFPDKTLYPVSSCNDQDFANLMDVYLDAVFYPSIHTKKEIFQQEGGGRGAGNLGEDPLQENQGIGSGRLIEYEEKKFYTFCRADECFCSMRHLQVQ